jgi:hypothetical protein
MGHGCRYRERRYVCAICTSSYPADRPVDDIIAELHKQQSKKRQRNTDPSPQITCSWGWCLDHSTTPPTIPDPRREWKCPATKTRVLAARVPAGFLSRSAPMRWRWRLRPLTTSRLVITPSERRTINAALPRYNDALKEKPEDSAIHVRLGRVLEKLNQFPQAIEQYEAAQKIAGPKKLSDEAKSAILRLQRPPHL